MRLVSQVCLFFKEGNSDKLYEIDLCDVGNNLYVVNFRYGKRGNTLKEGTKTPEAVSPQKAQAIFQQLEAEKTAKGYQTLDAITEAKTTPAEGLVQPAPTTITDWKDLPEGRTKALLKRLHLSIEGKEHKQRFPWKTSRVIWMAGVLKIKEAESYILQLANKGDAMQQYAAAWALGRCGTEMSISLLLTYFKSGNSQLQRIANEALLLLLKGEERTKHLRHHLHSLPVPFQEAIHDQQTDLLKTLLQERVIEQQQQQYNLLEDLYTLTLEYSWIKTSLHEVLLQLPLRPNYFKHIRHLLKVAELRDDFETIGLLAHRFEKEEAMFRKPYSAYLDDENLEVYVPSIEHWIKPKVELTKKASRVAYSNRTKHYLVKRTLRQLVKYGECDDNNYVRLATGLLLAYDKTKDYIEPFSTWDYKYQNGRYDRVETRFPANAYAIYLNTILYGSAPNMKLLPSHVWQLVEPAITTGTMTQSPAKHTGTAPVEKSGGLLNKLLSFFGSKKTPAAPEVPTPATEEPEIISTPGVTPAVPYLHLWYQLPQAFLQLLMHARMDEIHVFAVEHLKQHPNYSAIKEKIDAPLIQRLLTSAFDIPASFAFSLALEKYNAQAPDVVLVKALIYSRLPDARLQGMKWVDENELLFLSDTSFTSDILLCPHESVRAWWSNKIKEHPYTVEQAQAICGKTIATLITATDNSESTTITLTHTVSLLLQHFAETLKETAFTLIVDLLKSPVTAAQLLGIDLLILKRNDIQLDTLSNAVFYPLFDSAYQPIRERGMELLQLLSVNELLKRQELVMQCATNDYTDVRNGIRPVLKRMAGADPQFGVHSVDWLLPYLLRKEAVHGLHKDVAALLSNELLPYLKEVNKEMALRLLYADFVPTQEFGIAVLKQYIDPNELTIRQVIALGNHETLAVREWCHQFFIKHVARIKYERDEAIRLLDAKWDDTRAFAKNYFKEQFTEADWTPETLIAIADSVRPDIEAYGRELITRYFTDELGEQYLLKLSQHPSEKMQLFATNYLERFAANDPQKIEALSFYFRSVLSRVNKARIAKNRIFKFLLEEGKKSEEAAHTIGALITDISATVAIGDKAKCIEIMLALQSIYDITVPVKIKPVETRI